MNSRTTQGYVMVVCSYLLAAMAGTLVALCTAPPSVLLVLRFAVSFVVLALVFARRRRLDAVRAPGMPRLLLLMGVFDAATLLLFFFAIRETGVAIATFLYFMQPVWVALLAPRLLGSPTERVVFVAIGVALAGLVVILVPALSKGATHVSAIGLAAGVGSGLLYTCFSLLVKRLMGRLDSATLVLSQSALDGLILLPLALWQTLIVGYAITGRDLLVGLALGVVCTAVAYTLWMEGTRRVRMQHSAVLGFLTPVAAPFFALVLIDQSVTLWTVIGGSLILAAGVLVAVRGQVEVEEELPR
jgi:drug/metabolite transporter (DMT)-like permease